VNTRSLVALVVTAGALAAPHPASAADLYVQAGAGASPCSQDDPCSLQQAIAIADIVATRDTIHVAGALTPPGSVDLTRSPIDLVGSGGGSILRAADEEDSVHVGPDSSIGDLGLVNYQRAVVLAPGGRVRDGWIAASGRGIVSRTASDRASTIDGVDIETTTGAGIEIENAPDALATTISDVHIFGSVGIRAAGPFHLERSVVDASFLGVRVEGPQATIANTLVRAASFDGLGLLARGRAMVTVDGTTVVGDSHGRNGVRTDPGSPARITVRDSIVHGFVQDLSARTNLQGGGFVIVSGSNFAVTEGTRVVDAGGNTNADPRWRAGYRLAYDSPLIDRGSPAAAGPGETDLAGLPRVADGDDDGTAARDIGAFEYQYARPVAAIGADRTHVAPGTAVAFDASGSSYSAEPIASYDWDLDGDGTFETATGSTPRASRTYQSPGATTVRVRVRAEDGATGVAETTVTVRAPEPPTTPPRTTPAPMPNAPAALTVELRGRKLRLDRRGRGSLAVSCNATPCAVNLVVATTGKRPRTLARATGKAGKLRLRLSRSRLAYVKKQRVRRVAVSVVATATGGRTAQGRRILIVLQRKP
jgi:PKD repeat protein